MRLLGFVMGVIFLCGVSLAEPVSGISERLNCLSAYADILYAGSERNVYEIIDNNAKKIYTSKNESKVNKIYLDSEGKIFVCTDDGLYVRNRKKFEAVFSRSIDDSYISVRDMKEEGDLYYIATSEGVWSSIKKELVFKKIYENKSDNSFVSLACDEKGVLHGLTEKSLYKFSPDNANAEKIASFQSESENDNSENKAMAIFKEKILVATHKGLQILDVQNSYMRSNELINVNVVNFEQSGEILYIATKSGLYAYSKNFNKKVDGDISDIVSTMNNVYYISSGIINRLSDENIEYLDVLKQVKLPSIKDLHVAVMKYNEISPEKITKWRNKSKAKALMPTVDLDYRSSIYGTAGTGTYDGKYIKGPNDWSVGLSWNVGDMIWSDDETTIDNRSKLNTQLRLELLEEVNRLYYELKRTHLKLAGLNPESSKYIDFEIKKEELIASLDAYSGGWMSSQYN